MQKTIYSKMNFVNMASLSMFLMEFSGQISDGMWENSRPYDHWEWVCHTEYGLDSTPGYYGMHHRKRYNIKAWLNIWKTPGYEFATRVIDYAKFGSIINPYEVDKFIKVAENLRLIIDYLPENKISIEELKKSFKDTFIEKYFTEDVMYFITEENLEKFYSSEYSLKDFRKDIFSVYDSVNTYLGYKF